MLCTQEHVYPYLRQEDRGLREENSPQGTLHGLTHLTYEGFMPEKARPTKERDPQKDRAVLAHGYLASSPSNHSMLFLHNLSTLAALSRTIYPCSS
jgi:hypothetical protein